MLKFTVKCFN